VCDDEDLLSFFVKVVGHESLSVKMHSVKSIQVTFHLMSLLESFQEISILFIELLEAFLMVVISHHLKNPIIFFKHVMPIFKFKTRFLARLIHKFLQRCRRQRNTTRIQKRLFQPRFNSQHQLRFPRIRSQEVDCCLDGPALRTD
jgi:hypothetical protein